MVSVTFKVLTSQRCFSFCSQLLQVASMGTVSVQCLSVRVPVALLHQREGGLGTTNHLRQTKKSCSSSSESARLNHIPILLSQGHQDRLLQEAGLPGWDIHHLETLLLKGRFSALLSTFRAKVQDKWMRLSFMLGLIVVDSYLELIYTVWFETAS